MSVNEVIKCAVAGSFVKGSGQVIGAAGSFNDVTIELSFGSAWESTVRTVEWHNARGEVATTTILTTNLLKEGELETYLVPVPASVKQYAGVCTMDIRGAEVENGASLRVIMSATAMFSVLQSLHEGTAEDISASLAEQLQAEVESIKPFIVVLPDMIDEAKDAIAEVKTGEKARDEAESIRQSNEEARQETEAGRVAAEEGRVAAEAERQRTVNNLEAGFAALEEAVASGALKGDPGTPGAPGKDGTNGKDGINGVDGRPGSIWYMGGAISGEVYDPTSFLSDVSYAHVGDCYLNPWTGDVYRCCKEGDESTAQWIYVGNIKGAKGDPGAPGETVDLTPITEKVDTLEGTVDELFQSVSDGKALVAAAITDKGVETAATETFQQMAENIAGIQSGGGVGGGVLSTPADVPIKIWGDSSIVENSIEVIWESV